MSPIGILLVDDHPIVREGYRRLIERQRDHRVVAEAETAAEAYEAYRRVKPDVVVMDVSLPGVSGIEALRHIRQWDKAARVLVFSMHQGAAYALKAFEAGAAGYITKSSAPDELIRSIDVVVKGGRALSDDVAREIAADRLAGQRPGLDDLGLRETEILRMVASGMPAVEIADKLCLSAKTIQNYHSQIKAKMGARTDAQLVWLAVRAGLLTPEGME